MSYLATIAKLEKTRRFPDADFLQVAQCLGDNVVVGLDAKDGDLVIHFSDDGQLSPEFLFENNLYNKPEMNKDPEKKGFFCTKGRVRAQVFRKMKSEAYVCSLDNLKFTGIDISTLTLGTRFDTLNGVKIANKYITPATLRAAKGNQPKQKTGLVAYLKDKFKEHVDTEQLKYTRNEDLIGLVTLTHKLHGTSARSAYLEAPIEQPMNIILASWNKLVDKIYFSIVAKHKSFTEEQRSKVKFLPKLKDEWVSIYGTRRVTKGQVTDKYDDFRTKAHKMLEPFMTKGETWYYEIVGFEAPNSPIMQRVGCKELPKECKKLFPEVITYKYGCMDGEFDIYIYRVTTQSEDGYIYELPWSHVKNRCAKAGVKHVPEIKTLIVNESNVEEFKAGISKIVEETIVDPIDNSHPFEGVCVRIDNLENGRMKILKKKGLIFSIGEGIIKLNDDAIDEEESQG